MAGRTLRMRTLSNFSLVSRLICISILLFSAISCQAFVAPHKTVRSRACRQSQWKQVPPAKPLLSSESSSGYVPQDESNSGAGAATADSSRNDKNSKQKRLHPAVGDIVRFYDLDGGRADGQVLIGRISFIQKQLLGTTTKDKSASGWLLEISELDDVGDGYFTDYSFQKRRSKKTMRDLATVSPIAASFVRSEDAFKVPLDPKTKLPLVRAERYDIEDFPGPFAGDNAVNKDVILADAEVYGALKSKLLRYAAITGFAGAIICDLVKGTEDALIYAAGVAASLLYLFFLTVKTDTVASQEAKLGSNVSNLRFIAPLLVLVGIAFYNKSLGDSNPVLGKGPFDTVTAEQFGAAILGFLTYRVPLFLTQLQDALKDEDGDIVLPGSAGVAVKLAKEGSSSSATSAVLDSTDDALSTVLVVSGPQATGRSVLVQALIEQGEGKFVAPKLVDRVKDSAKFERLDKRDEFLSLDSTGRFGMTKECILNTAKECGPDSVVVVDANVDLARKLTSVAGIRLVGVWIGLDSMSEFEARLGHEIDSGEIEIPEDETRESVVRARSKEIVQEIEFGISSGVFEFTIINDNTDESMKQLREAASYCFK